VWNQNGSRGGGEAEKRDHQKITAGREEKSAEGVEEGGLGGRKKGEKSKEKTGGLGKARLERVKGDGLGGEKQDAHNYSRPEGKVKKGGKEGKA